MSSITGPMNGCGSAWGWSTMIRSISLVISPSSASCWPSSTISRRAAVQRCPAERKADWTTIAAAAGRSLAPHTTIGLLPPSSSARILCGVSANWRWSDMPARAEPVNSKPSMPSSCASARPWSGPPTSKRTTPAGTPASWKQSTSIAPVAGVFSDGLNTTALPASSAGTMWPLGRCAGKLYGPSTASTPCGLWRTATLLPSAASSRRVGVRSPSASTEISTLLMTAPTSVLASQKGLPVSRAMRSANSCSRARTMLAKRRSVSTRNITECAAHAGHAARAAATSAAASPTGPDQICAPVAGSKEISCSVMTLPVIGALLPCRRAAVKPGRSGSGSIGQHRVPHPADGGDLGLERGPVVALGDRAPDRLDLVDQHRARRGVGPVSVGEGTLAPLQRRREPRERRAFIVRRPPGRGPRASRRTSDRSRPRACAARRARPRPVRGPRRRAASRRGARAGDRTAPPRTARASRRAGRTAAAPSPISARQPASCATSHWIASGWRPKA